MNISKIDKSKTATAKARLVRKKILQAKRRIRLLRHKQVQTPLINHSPTNTPLSGILNNVYSHNLPKAVSPFENIHASSSTSNISSEHIVNKDNVPNTKVQISCSKPRPKQSRNSVAPTRSPLGNITSAFVNQPTNHVHYPSTLPQTESYLPPVMNTNNVFGTKNRPHFQNIQVNLSNKFDSVDTTSHLPNFTTAQPSSSNTSKRKQTTIVPPFEMANHSESFDSSEDEDFENESQSESEDDDLPASASKNNLPVLQGL
ncbi:hypothetical protein TSUD_376710 [Trifolium subterraneum]|uniref:Uncharacterized protein n=1 Tax=Trifolium subterraneum TaxID=3900 RepID=A0A2Z6NYD6_TRISU|nr:hypothetical protein TSUD_376710 [Trifolium subterraneum]